MSSLLLSLSCGDGSQSRLAGLKPCDPASRPVAAVVGTLEDPDPRDDLVDSGLWLMSADGSVSRVQVDGSTGAPSMAGDASGLLYKKFRPPVEGETQRAPSLMWLDLATDKHSVVLDYAPGGGEPAVPSPDGVTYALRGTYAGSANPRIGIGSRRSSARPTPLTALPPTPENFGESRPAWSPDGKSLAYVASMFSAPSGVPHQSVWVVDMAAGARRAVHTVVADSSTQGVAWSSDGTTLLVTYTQAGKWHGIEVPVAGGQPRPVPMVGRLQGPAVYGDAQRGSVVGLAQQDGKGSLLRWNKGSESADSSVELDVPKPTGIAIARCALNGSSS